MPASCVSIICLQNNKYEKPKKSLRSQITLLYLRFMPQIFGPDRQAHKLFTVRSLRTSSMHFEKIQFIYENNQIYDSSFQSGDLTCLVGSL